MADEFESPDADTGGRSRRRDDHLAATLIGVAATAAVAGAAFLFSGRRGRAQHAPEQGERDAPPATRRDSDLVSHSVTINRPARELYDFWHRFERLPEFMDNLVAVERIDGERSRWRIKAPGGTEVSLVNRVTEDVPGRLIAWDSEPESQIRNSGRIEFLEAPPGRGTIVRATIDYDPPLGALGKLAAKALQREPAIQARRDLRRFKQLVETGEIATSAGPSARRSEDPTRQYP